MSHPKSLFNYLFSLCVQSAIDSTNNIRNIRKEAMGVDEKYTFLNYGSTFNSIFRPGEGPVTIADTSTQIFIESVLRKAFPKIKIVGEEDSKGSVGDKRKKGEDASRVDHTIAAAQKFEQQLPRPFYPAANLDDIIVFIDPLVLIIGVFTFS